MKITVQEKIAELEQRIVALEKQRPTTTATTTRTMTSKGGFGKHWDAAWREFDLAFRDIFK